jgi:hypothetical protein
LEWRHRWIWRRRHGNGHLGQSVSFRVISSVLLYLSWETIEEKHLQLAFSGQVALDGRIRSRWVTQVFIFTNIYLLEMVLHIRCTVVDGYQFFGNNCDTHLTDTLGFSSQKMGSLSCSCVAVVSGANRAAEQSQVQSFVAPSWRL